jgi:hypothetical protein
VTYETDLVIAASPRRTERDFETRSQARRRRLTVDVTGIVTEKDTSERGECTHEVGLQGDRRLDDGSSAVDVGHGEGRELVVVVVVDKGEIAIMIRRRVDDRSCRRENEGVWQNRDGRRKSNSRWSRGLERPVYICTKTGKAKRRRASKQAKKLGKAIACLLSR